MGRPYISDNNYIPEPNSGCWIWLGRVDKHGYGKYRPSGTRGELRAHRVFYERYSGQITAGLMVCHHCDNRLCVNPDHLFTGTAQDNVDDMVRKGRNAAPPLGVRFVATTHCPNGHEYTPENTVYRDKVRPGIKPKSCRICRRARERMKYARRKAAIQSAHPVHIFS